MNGKPALANLEISLEKILSSLMVKIWGMHLSQLRCIKMPLNIQVRHPMKASHSGLYRSATAL